MTRVLSQILEAKEPDFRQTIDRLERSCGNACHDIRLNANLIRQEREKIITLGLDPDDTTGEELYHTLQAKLKADDLKLIKHLRTISARHISAEGNISDGIAYALNNQAKTNKAFAVKNTAVKQLLSKLPPKRTMKATGYRSLASMLKHEPLGLIITMALEMETDSWVNSYYQKLAEFSARDCESRQIKVYCPSAGKWAHTCLGLMAKLRTTVLVNKELSTVIILPLPSNEPKPGLTSATLAIGLAGINEIHSSSSYLKLSQLATDFGQRVQSVSMDEPKLGINFPSSPLSWETVQRFLHHMADFLETPIDSPIDIGELTGWQPIESMAAKIAPELDFWKSTGHVGRLDRRRPISMNFLDNALCLCNRRSYANRIYHHLQRSLWQELIIRYIRPELLSDAINQELQPRLATETINA